MSHHPFHDGLQHWVYHANGDMGADVTHMVPILILFFKMLVLRQVRIVQIEWKRIGKLIGKLLKRRSPIRLRVVSVEFRQCVSHAIIAQHATHRGNIKIIPRSIALQHEYGLDPEHLFFCRDCQPNTLDLYLDRL